ncbi:MAG: hypothetical protein ACM3KR_11180 [Deltaproteobacteria bacterium]
MLDNYSSVVGNLVEKCRQIKSSKSIDWILNIISIIGFVIFFIAMFNDNRIIQSIGFFCAAIGSTGIGILEILDSKDKLEKELGLIIGSFMFVFAIIALGTGILTLL